MTYKTNLHLYGGWTEVANMTPGRGNTVEVRYKDGSTGRAVYQPQQWSFEWCRPGELARDAQHLPITHWRPIPGVIEYQSQCFHCCAVLPNHRRGCPNEKRTVKFRMPDDIEEETCDPPNKRPCVVKVIATNRDASKLVLLEVDSEIIALFPPYQDNMFNLLLSSINRDNWVKIELVVNNSSVLTIQFDR